MIRIVVVWLFVCYQDMPYSFLDEIINILEITFFDLMIFIQVNPKHFQNNESHFCCIIPKRWMHLLSQTVLIIIYIHLVIIRIIRLNKSFWLQPNTQLYGIITLFLSFTNWDRRKWDCMFNGITSYKNKFYKKRICYENLVNKLLKVMYHIILKASYIIFLP